MYMHVCVCVCMCLFMYVCVCVCMCVRKIDSYCLAKYVDINKSETTVCVCVCVIQLWSKVTGICEIKLRRAIYGRVSCVFFRCLDAIRNYNHSFCMYY